MDPDPQHCIVLSVGIRLQKKTSSPLPDKLNDDEHKVELEGGHHDQHKVEHRAHGVQQGQHL